MPNDGATSAWRDAALRRGLDLVIAASGLSFLVLGGALTALAMLGMTGHDPLRRAGGVCLIGISALLLIPRSASRRRMAAVPAGHPGSAPGLGDRDTSSGPSLRDRAIVGALASFAMLQLLDVVTTLLGGHAGLREGNRLAAELMALLGPATGFVAVKAAAVIVMILAITRMPRQVALATGWGSCSLMACVVFHNAYLILS